MSSRSFDPTLPANRAGVTAVIAIRCPQCGQGRRKLGRCEGATPLKDTEYSRIRHDRSTSPISGPIRARVKKNLCNAHKIVASRHGLANELVTELLAVDLDQSSSRMRKMDRQHESTGSGDLAQESPARLRRL